MLPRKMAVFVEGYTELLFVDRLIQAIAEQNSVYIEKRKIRGGSTCRRTSQLIEATSPLTTESHFVLIYDCGNDELAKDRIVEEYANLARNGYTKVICIRDVYPILQSDIVKLEMRLPKFVPTKPIVVDFILSIMEIEAWFMAEHTHFGRVDAELTAAAIHAALGFNPQHDDMSLRSHPAADLHQCYSIVGKSYTKGDVACICHLDYGQIYLDVVAKFAYLRKLCEIIDEFLSPPLPQSSALPA